MSSWWNTYVKLLCHEEDPLLRRIQQWISTWFIFVLDSFKMGQIIVMSNFYILAYHFFQSSLCLSIYPPLYWSTILHTIKMLSIVIHTGNTLYYHYRSSFVKMQDTCAYMPIKLLYISVCVSVHTGCLHSVSLSVGKLRKLLGLPQSGFFYNHIKDQQMLSHIHMLLYMYEYLYTNTSGHHRDNPGHYQICRNTN